MARPKAHNIRPVRRPDQEAERARWLLLATLAKEYSERFLTLFEAMDFYLEALERAGGSEHFLAVFSVRTHTRAFSSSELNAEGYVHFFFPGKIGPEPLSLAIGAWAERIGLTECSGFHLEHFDTQQKTLLFRPAGWVAKHAVVLLEAGISGTDKAHRFCIERSEDGVMLGELLTGGDLTPYPDRPDLFFVPRIESKEGFLKRARGDLEAYAEAILAWHIQHGYQPSEDYRASEQHFRWLAWHHVERLTFPAIAARESNDFGRFPDAGDIGKVLRRLTRLVGIVKELEPEDSVSWL